MTRPCYFVVARLMGRPAPMLYWDELPREPIRHLEYVVRLDELAPSLVTSPLADLFAVYLRLKKLGKLPPRWEPPPRPKAEAARNLLGHRESPWAVIERSRAKEVSE